MKFESTTIEWVEYKTAANYKVVNMIVDWLWVTAHRLSEMQDGESAIQLPRMFQSGNGTWYRQGRYLGSGGYAVVVSAERVEPLGTNDNQKNVVAIKTMLKTKLAQYAPREMEIMHRLRHTHILRLYEHFEDTQLYYLVLELCSNQVNILLGI